MRFTLEKKIKKLRELEKIYGSELVKEHVQIFIKNKTIKEWQKIANRSKDNNLDTFVDILWNQLCKVEGIKFTINKKNDNIKIHCTYCPAVEQYKKLDALDWGYELYCKTDYYMVEVINLILQSSMCPPEYVGLTTVDITDLMYYDQWANASMGQLDLGDLLGLPYSVIGFEAGTPQATNISLATTLELFNPANNYAFMNITYSGNLPSLQETDGLAKWLVANGTDDIANATKVTLKSVFSLEDFQFDKIDDNGCIRAVMRGQHITLANKIKELDSKGWKWWGG